MQAQELKSLVESGNYKPDPSRIAAAMLQRRGVRELLTGPRSTRRAAGRSPPPPAVRPPGSLISTPSPASDLADRRQRRLPPLRRSRVEASASRSAGQRRQQLVVLAARGGQLERVAPGRRGDLGDALGQRQRAGVDPQARRRCAAARWPASPPRPSLRSIIAVAPAAASAAPARSRGRGSSWRRAQPLGGLGRDRGAELGSLEQQQAGRGAAELAGEDEERRRAGRRRG